jgi:hypothetical protein
MGAVMPQDTIKQAFINGTVDRIQYGLLRAEQLYRRPWVLRWAWRCGWEFGNLVTRRPLRTAHRRDWS